MELGGQNSAKYDSALSGQTKKPTLADVAATAGVALSTVSLVFSKSKQVSPAMRERVFAAARTLHYEGPDPRGQSLRRGHSKIVGVLIDESIRDAFQNPVTISYLDGIAREITQPAGGLLLLSRYTAPVRDVTMDGLIMIGNPQEKIWAIRAARRSLPAAVLGGRPQDNLPAVTIDDYDATFSLADYLHVLGHRRVSVVALPLGDTRTPGWRSFETPVTGWHSQQRLAAVEAVFGPVPVWVTSGSLVEEGRAAAAHLLAPPGPERPTAIIAQSDLLAVGVILAAEQLGLKVPEQLSVVGFDGIRMDSVIPHDLTTVIQPATEQGRAAARLVLHQIFQTTHSPSIQLRSVLHRGGTAAAPVNSFDVNTVARYGASTTNIIDDIQS